MNTLNLNDKQVEAVKSVEGVYNISSGAGTGKTTVVAHRIANMIKNLKIPASEILAITYTNSAADEMNKRIRALCGKDVECQISTIHVFAKLMIDKYYKGGESLMWATPDFSQKALEAVTGVDRFSALNVMRCITEIESGRKKLSDFNDIIQKYYNLYADFLQKIHRISFDGALNILNKLLDDPAVLEGITNTYKYVIVDEFQDINTVQFEIIQKLASKNKNLFVVGDINQSIYGFNGSDYTIMNDFEMYYPEAKTINVNENYRSGENIIKVANRISESSELKSEPLSANKDKTGAIKVIISEYADDLYYDVADNIAQNVKTGGLYKDNAIIARTNWELSQMAKVLKRRGIPYVIYSQPYTETLHTMHIFEHILFFENKLDNIGCYDLITRYLGLAYDDIDEIYDICMTGNALSYLIAKGDEFKELGLLIWKLRDKYVEISDKNVREVMSEICRVCDHINETTYKKHNLAYSENERYSISYDLEKFLGSIEFSIKRGVKFKGFEQFSKLVSSFDPTIDTDDVKLLTGHRAKGLEFKNVHLLNVTDNKFPMVRDNPISQFTKFSVDFDEELKIAEELRLFYVIITRAMESLTLYVPTKQISFGGKIKDVAPSRFIKEIRNLLDGWTISGNNK